MKAIAYRRVSTDAQADSGLGLDAQQAAIEQAAARLGLPLAETFTDAGLSGGLALEHRPALLAAVDRVGPGDILLVAKRDRLGRDVLNTALIERLVQRKGARIVSASGEGTDDDGPTSILMRQIIDAFSQYERQIIRHRTRVAMAAAKRRGQRVGHIPWGHSLGADGRTLVPNAEERATLREIHQLRRCGYALISIAADLNERGVPTRRGGTWKCSFISQLLTRHPCEQAA